MNDSFFDKIKPNSQQKIDLTLAYFKQWLQAHKTQKELFYIDLFSGPGVYHSGEYSVPILILKEILLKKSIANRFHIILNDKNKKYILKLSQETNKLSNIEEIKSITYSKRIVGQDMLNDLWEPNAPVFLIIDPFGYKGIHYKDILSFLKDPNCSIVLLFSFNQLYRFFHFNGIAKHLKSFFSTKTFNRIRSKISRIQNKEIFILSEFCRRLKLKNYLTFRFQFHEQNKTSHFLIFMNIPQTRYKKFLTFLKKSSNNKNTLFYISEKPTPQRFNTFFLQMFLFCSFLLPDL